MFAQLDTLHFIAPMHARIYQAPYPATQYHEISISTPSNNNVNYSILRSDGTVLQSGVVSSNSPVLYAAGQNNGNNLFVPIDSLNIVLREKGFIVQTSEPSFVTYRLTSLNNQSLNPAQAELMVSKGQSALGTEFRVGGIPLGSGGGYRSSFFSIMAEENNTQVNITGWPTGVILNGVPTITPTGVSNYNLDAGESLVFSLYNDHSANLDAQLGLHIQSTKNIVLQNGSNHGSMIPNSDAQDILIEQSVPVSRTGQEYILKRGMESNSVEVVIVFANVNGTDIFINGSATPQYTLNAGEYQVIDGSNYNSNGVMYIESSNSIYCYQQIGGTNNQGKNTGLALKAPISCGLFSNYESLHSLNQWQQHAFDHTLNIFSKVTDTVWVTDDNGLTTFLPGSGFVVPGNSSWEVNVKNLVIGDFTVSANGGIILDSYGAEHNSGFTSSFGGFDPQPGSKTTVQDSACLNAPFQFSFVGFSNSSYTFDHDGGQLISGSGLGPYEMSFDSLGIFTVSLIETGTQCPDTQEIQIAVIDEYEPSFTQVGDSELCPDESVWFYVDSNQAHFSVTWFDGGGGYSRQVNNSGDVWYLAQGICETYSDTVSVSVKPEPEFTSFNDTLLCGTEELMVDVDNSEDHYNYHWTDGYIGADRLIDSSGVYELLASNDCGTFSSGPLTIDFGTCHCHVWIPNAFTPNGNRLNEGFGVAYDCSLETFEMEIYNRWGQKLYHAFSADDKWDGMYAGEMSATGVYLYVISYTYRNDYGALVRESKEGTVTLLR